MSIVKRLKDGVKAYDLDNMSQNDFINDISISRNIFFRLMKDQHYYKKLMPRTRRKILENLELLDF